jgi:hypothetical protein
VFGIWGLLHDLEYLTCQTETVHIARVKPPKVSFVLDCLDHILNPAITLPISTIVFPWFFDIGEAVIATNGIAPTACRHQTALGIY